MLLKDSLAISLIQHFTTKQRHCVSCIIRSNVHECSMRRHSPNTWMLSEVSVQFSLHSSVTTAIIGAVG